MRTASPPLDPAEFGFAGANLVFVSLTNTRPDHLGCYGYTRDTSPAIDALASDGLVFEDVFTHASWTLPAVVSLLTSRYPFEHGMMNRADAEPLSPDVITLVDVLKANGYETGAFVGDRDYGPVFGHTSRFDTVVDAMSGRELDDWKEYGVLKNVLPAALEWLRAHRDDKFFLLVQGYDTHCPFGLPEENPVFDPDYAGETDFSRCYWTFRRTSPIEVKRGESVEKVWLLKSKPLDGDEYESLFSAADVHHMVALYDGEIRLADAEIAGLLGELRRLGLEEKTIVVFFSDHGDMFGKHGRFMRGGPLRGTFYDDVLRVPLIVRHPRLPHRRIEGLAGVIDIAPTLLDMLGITPPPGYRGRSLRPLITGGERVRETVFAGASYTPKRRNVFFRQDSIITAVRTEGWKLIHERVFDRRRTVDLFELFELTEDPDELRNVAAERPEEVARLRESIDRWLTEIGADDVMRQLANQEK